MSFYRTELRTLQIMSEGDNELFLTQVASMLEKLTLERDDLKTKVRLLEYELEELKEL